MHSLVLKYPRIAGAVVPISVGVLVGLIVMRITGMPSKWAVAFALFLSIPLIMFVTRNVKMMFFGLLVLSIPMNADMTFVMREHVGGAYGISLSVSDMAVFFLYAYWLVKILLERKATIRFFPRTTLPLAAFILVAVLSTMKSADVELSVFEIIRIVKLFLMYFFVANHTTKKDLKYIVVFLMLGMFLQCVLVSAQYGLGMTFGLQVLGENQDLHVQQMDSGGSARVAGTLGGPNALAKYLEFLLPLALSVILLIRNNRVRLASATVAAAGLGALIVTLSRGAWVGFVFGIIVMMLATLKTSVSRTKILIGILVLCLILGGVLIGFWELITSRILSDDYGSAESRFTLMRAASAIIRAHPLLGIGINNYTVVLRHYDPTGMWFVWPHPVHNVYLLVLAEMGFLGLAALLWLLGSLVSNAFRSLRSDDSLCVATGLGLLAGILALGVHWMVDWQYLGDNMLLWFAAGLLAAIGSPVCHDASSLCTEHVSIQGSHPSA